MPERMPGDPTMKHSDDRLAKPARDGNSRSPQDPLRLLDDLEVGTEREPLIGPRRPVERVGPLGVKQFALVECVTQQIRSGNRVA